MSKPNKRDMRGYRFTSRNKVRKYIDEIKSKGCVICGYNKCLDALDFHHVIGGKKFGISDNKNNLKRVKEEVCKCICVCSNCHREIHAGIVEGYENIQTIHIDIKISTQKQLSFWD